MVYASRKTERRSRINGLALLCAALALLIVSCGSPASETPAVAPDPFSSRRESEDGAIVAWSGNTGGYEPGAEAEFELTLQNETEQRWRGRYCLLLLDRELPQVIATLEQREFTLDPGVGFSDTLIVRLPEALDEGTYGLSLAVQRPGGAMVDLVPIQVGETDETRRTTTQQDMDAALAACPTAVPTSEQLVEQAQADLAQQLGITPDEIDVLNVVPTEFPDASLGVPEPGKVYAQVITPGYIIELAAQGETYRYHASEERVVAAPGDTAPQPPQGAIAISGVEATAEQVTLRGKSSLPEDSCISTELWADGVLVSWWPTDLCATVEQGLWELTVPLQAEQVLEPGVQYMARAFQAGGPNIVATFAFDLEGPPPPPPN